MTRENKELLLKDLCARLPYGVKVLDNSHKNYGVSKLINIGADGSMLVDNELNDIQYYPIINETKPYLRPMSSMTEEELFEVQDIIGKGVEICNGFIDIVDSSIHRFTFLELQAVFNWLLKNHFDFMDLIPKGLAIKVTEENNPYEN